MAEENIQLTITEEITEIIASNTDAITVGISGDDTALTVNTFALPSTIPSAQITFTPYGQVTATTVQDAVKQLVDLASYAQPAEPSAVGGSSVSEGNIWYDTDDDQVKIYRETSSGVFEWVPIILGAAGADSDTLDAGAF